MEKKRLSVLSVVLAVILSIVAFTGCTSDIFKSCPYEESSYERTFDVQPLNNILWLVKADELVYENFLLPDLLPSSETVFQTRLNLIREFFGEPSEAMTIVLEEFDIGPYDSSRGYALLDVYYEEELKEYEIVSPDQYSEYVDFLEKLVAAVQLSDEGKNIDPYFSFTLNALFMESEEMLKAPDDNWPEGRLGFKLNRDLTIRSLRPGMPAQVAGIQVGDKIIAINGQKVENCYIGRVIEHLIGKPGTSVTLTIKRPPANKELIFDLIRNKYPESLQETIITTWPSMHLPSLGMTEMIFEYSEVLQEGTLETHTVSFALLDKEGKEAKDIFYIRIPTFEYPSISEELTHILEQLDYGQLKGMIIDLRNNPGGDLETVENVLSLFFPPETLVAQIQGQDESIYEVRVKENDTIKTSLVPPEIPIVILGNERTASAAEIFIGAFQDYKRGVLVGEQTRGKGFVTTGTLRVEGILGKIIDEIPQIESEEEDLFPLGGLVTTSGLWVTPKGNFVGNFSSFGEESIPKKFQQLIQRSTLGLTPDVEVKDAPEKRYPHRYDFYPDPVIWKAIDILRQDVAEK